MKSLINTFKKLGAIALVGAFGLISSYGQTLSISATLTPGQISNLVLVTRSPLRVAQAIITSTTATNASFNFIDSPSTTNITYVTLPYTNYLSYATNYVWNYTNYYGVVNTYSNISQVDYTNSVGQATNFYPVRLALTSLASSAQVYILQNATFNTGILVTNTGSGTGQVTITYNPM
jgi:hypothetical protein